MSQPDWGLIAGMAATTVGSISAWNSRRTKRVLGAPQSNGDPAPTLSELLTETVSFEAYVHTRIHDMLNNEAVIYTVAAEIARALDVPVPTRDAILDSLASRMSPKGRIGGTRWSDPNRQAPAE
jgi:hypothetical protein